MDASSAIVDQRDVDGFVSLFTVHAEHHLVEHGGPGARHHDADPLRRPVQAGLRWLAVREAAAHRQWTVVVPASKKG
jgi:hypothetical protein